MLTGGGISPCAGSVNPKDRLHLTAQVAPSLNSRLSRPQRLTVFSFGAVLVECSEGDVGVVLAALL